MRFAIALATVLVCSVAGQESGIHITMKETRGDSSSLLQIAMDRSHIRVEGDEAGLVLLFDAARPVIYQVDAVRKRYAALDQEEFERMLQEVLDRALVNLTPEQRQQVIAAMPSAGSPFRTNTAPAQSAYQKVGPDTVGGYECMRYELVPSASGTDPRVRASASSTEVCVAPPQVFGLGADDFAVIATYMRRMSDLMPGGIPAPGGQDLPYVTGIADGQPFSGVSLRFVKRIGATTKASEVVRVQREAFPPSTFALPADLQKVSMVAFMSR